ncbi:LacI family DNA-binding transcriptional regulator [Marisediminicola sp. LYQ85]|uniref:LacI family DNA-binding transcriptional regulator n=1 Tax=Marisediminicola sp. LYQ85 TaxID=3391062 RepID=UPI003983537E
MAVTRADVARRAGVSPAVVSYVLNPGSRPVSAAARSRIEDAIRELGYRPNAIAQALRRSSTMSLGLLVPDLANPVVASLVRAVEDIAYDLGYVLFIGTIGHDLTREKKYISTYVDRQVDALILLGAHAPDLLATIARRGTPVIVLDRVEHGRGISTITTESVESSAAGVTHLIEQHGHKRIACITGPSAAAAGIAEDRVNGWRLAMERAGLEAGDDLLYRAADFTRSSGHTAALHLLESTDLTAFFVVSDVQAVGAIGAIRERDLFVPSDIAVVSYDGTETAARAFPRLTTVDVDIDNVAEWTMKRLIEKLKKSDTSETHDVLPAELIIRRSCGCDAAV